jgi:hypothetical protein
VGLSLDVRLWIPRLQQWNHWDARRSSKALGEKW